MESDWRFWGVVGLGAAAVGILSSGAYYVGYKNGRRAREVDTASGKSYEYKYNPMMRYLLEHNKENPVLKKLRDFTLTLPEGSMATPVEEGNLLTLLCRAIGARKVIDVGVFTGCSAYAMALGLPAEGKVVACDVSWEYVKLGQPYWEEGGMSKKIHLCIQPAIKTLQELLENGEEGSYDIMFIDADKKNYPKYYELGIRLLRSGGLLIVDNALGYGENKAYHPENMDEGVIGIRAVDRMMMEDERVESVLLNVGEGVCISLKK